MDRKFPNKGSSREVLEDVQYFLMRSGNASLADVELLFPEYPRNAIYLALDKLTRLGKATVERRKDGKVWFWVMTSVRQS